MMCHRIGLPPISIIGFGRMSVSSLIRVPAPPARITAFMGDSGPAQGSVPRGRWISRITTAQDPEALPSAAAKAPRPFTMCLRSARAGTFRDP